MKKIPRFSRISAEKFLPIAVNRTVVFFFLMCLLTIFFYAAGTVQGFIDSTQLALLRFYTFLGIFLSIISVFGFFLELNRAIRVKMLRYFVRALSYLLLMAFGIVTVLGVLFILALSEGNRL